MACLNRTIKESYDLFEVLADYEIAADITSYLYAIYVWHVLTNRDC